jgi:hypothetical protein
VGEIIKEKKVKKNDIQGLTVDDSDLYLPQKLRLSLNSEAGRQRMTALIILTLIASPYVLVAKSII